MELPNLKGRIVIVGIGNTLRGDDGAGPELIKDLKKELQSSLDSKLFLMDVGEVPENYLGKISEHKPDVILLVDAVDFGSPPGSVGIIEKDALIEESLSTHNASLRLTMKYLKEQTKACIFLLGIQPENLQMGSTLSEPVKQAIEQIKEFLVTRLNESNPT